MEKSDWKNKIITGCKISFAIIFAIYLCLIVVSLIFPQEHFSFFNGQAAMLHDGFVIKDSGEEITIPRDNDSRYPDGITIAGTLPDNINDKDYLLVRLAHQDCTVTIDGKVVYDQDYTKERAGNHSIFASHGGYTALISLQEEDAGKPIEITYIGSLPGYASTIGMMAIFSP